MTKRQYVVIMFSRELALQSVKMQSDAVSKLHKYVRRRKVMWHDPKVEKMEKFFSDYFNGEVENLRAYVDAEKILFQPEIFRGHLNSNDIVQVLVMGFKIEAFHC